MEHVNHSIVAVAKTYKNDELTFKMYEDLMQAIFVNVKNFLAL